VPIPRKALLAKGMRFAMIAIAVSVAHAQPPADTHPERTLHFTQAGTLQARYEIAYVIRTVAGMQDVSIDDASSSLTVRGTPAQADLAEWLFRELDKPEGAHDTGSHEYRGAGDSGFQARVYYTAHVATVQDLQDLVNTIRALGDAQWVFADRAQQAIALRGRAGQVALLEWLLNALDVPQDGPPAATGRRPSVTYRYMEPQLLPSGARNPAAVAGDTVARVFYLAHTETLQGVLEIVNTIRTIAEIQRVSLYTKAVASRGTASQDALAEWLLNDLDTPAAESQDPVTHEYQMSGGSSDIVQVLHFPNKTAQQLQQIASLIRTRLNVQRLFTCPSKSAVALRGTPSQVTLAGQLIKERDTPGVR
jgi:hypothetical protein